MKRTLTVLALVVVVSGCANRKEICCPLDFRATDTGAYPSATSKYYAEYYAYPKDAAEINSSQALRMSGKIVPYFGPEATITQ